MTINMGVKEGTNADDQRKLLRERIGLESPALIFCQELPGHFKEVTTGYKSVEYGNEAAVMWKPEIFKGRNEVAKTTKKQRGERQAITFRAIEKAKELPSRISVVQLKKKSPPGSTLAVSYDGRYSELDEKVKHNIFLILVEFLNKVIEKNDIDSYIIGGDFDFDTSTVKLPAGVKILSYESGKANCQSCVDYYILRSRGAKCEQLIRAIHFENQEAPNSDQNIKISNRKHDKPNPSIGQNSTEEDRPRFVTRPNDVDEYVLSFDQSTKRQWSNACTIIAVLAAIDFLSGNKWFLQNDLASNLEPDFPNYCDELFTKGNEIYRKLDGNQVNYTAPEILEHPEVGLTDIAEKGDEYHYNNFANFVDFLRESQTAKLAFVLIFGDKSMVLLINEDKESMLIDSHKHLGTGAIVATAAQNRLENMINYIKKMVRRDWNLTVSEDEPFDVTTVNLSNFLSIVRTVLYYCVLIKTLAIRALSVPYIFVLCTP